METCRAEKMFALHAGVGHKASKNKDAFGKSGIQVEQAPPQIVLTFRTAPAAQSGKMLDRFGAEYISKLNQWMQETFLAPGDGATFSWVSGVELLVGFMLTMKFMPPVYIARRKRWERNPHLVASVPRRTRWFSQHLTGLARAHGVVIEFQPRWPSCAALGGKHQCLPLAFPEQQRAAILEFLRARLGACSVALNERWRSLQLPDGCFR